jgi:hypothetical protein
MAYRRRSGMGSLTTDLAAAIQRMEGACSGPTTCANNNPGNLRAYAAGQPVDSRGFRIFPDYQSGEAALQSQIDLNVSRGLSLNEFFGGKPGVYGGYAPASDANNPSGYASTVAGWLGIDPTVPLSGVSTGGGLVQTPDSGYLVDTSGPVDPGMSTVAMVGLGLAALGVLWAVTS